MPNADRNLFFELQGRPTHRRWEDSQIDLEQRVYRAFDRVQQAVAAAQNATRVHRAIVASLAGTRIFINFSAAQKYTLVLNTDVDELVFTAPKLTSTEAASYQLEIIQAGTSPTFVTAWTGLVFYAATDSPHMSGGLQVLSSTANYVDVLTCSYDGFSEQLRGMYVKGASA